jgi:dTMP kinase
MNSKGYLVTFEGIDGCGKTTQAELLHKHLINKGCNSPIFREPGGTVVGEKIRSILLDSANNDMEPLAELFLYLAARVQITHHHISPALENGDIVIMDRYSDSTVAYQGFARNIGRDVTQQLNKIATLGIVPDLTFIIDCSPETALARLSGKPDRLESEGVSFMNRVREGFLFIASAYPERCVLIDGEKPAGDISNLIHSVVHERLKLC